MPQNWSSSPNGKTYAAKCRTLLGALRLYPECLFPEYTNPDHFFIPNTLGPIWYPPVSPKWIFTFFVVFAGAVANKIKPELRGQFTNPVGFFLTSAAAVGAYSLGFYPASFAIIFFLLMVMLAQSTTEGFLVGSNTIDWVVNSKRWWVERVLKERPLGIREKGLPNLPISD